MNTICPYLKRFCQTVRISPQTILIICEALPGADFEKILADWLSPV